MAMKSAQRGNTLVGFILGLVVGLLIALVVAVLLREGEPESPLTRCAFREVPSWRSSDQIQRVPIVNGHTTSSISTGRWFIMSRCLLSQ